MPNEPNKKIDGLRKSMSRGALHDTTNLQGSQTRKKRRSRPGSSKSNSKSKHTSKKDSSFRSQNRSKSKDRSKITKEVSQNKKLDEKALLKNLKNTNKQSILTPLIEKIDKKEPKKVRPPKAPKQFKHSFKENILANIENLSLNKLRSRQSRELEKKSITITHSPKNSDLEMQSECLKRKSSFVNIKKGLQDANLNLLKGRKSLKKTKIKNALYKTQSQKLLSHVFSSISNPKTETSLDEYSTINREMGKRSLIESFTKGRPEIEYI